MSEEQPSKFVVDRLPGVPAQIRSIGAIATKAGKLAQFIEIMKTALRQLETNSVGWGDPLYHTIVSSGVVCHRIARPVVFHFVVYESDRLVVLLEVRVIGEFA